MNKEKLLKYCQKNKINIPSKANLEYIHAAIARAYLHGHEAPAAKNCFGFWENNNATCMTCDSEKNCFKSSIGMSKKEYFKKMDALDNKQLRMIGSMR